MIKLEPCPFCGGNAVANGGYGEFSAGCQKCYAAIEDPDFKSEEDAEEAWNKRTNGS